MLNEITPKSEFSKNVLTLMTGTTIAQAIPVAISPILTRLYSPEDFGVFALFGAITSIFGNIANGRYELAIMLPKKDEDAINIMALGFIINVILSLFLFLIIVIFHNIILNLLNNREISPWLYLVPVSVFLIGCFNLLNYFNNRKKYYKDLATANVYKSISMTVIQLSFGFLKTGVIGLISGQIFSQIILNLRLFINIKKLNLFSSIRKVKIITVGKRYKNFPRFSMWATLANTLSSKLTNILISSFYNTKTLGFYSLTQMMLGMPSSLIGSAIGQVFFEEATKEKQQTGKAVKTFNSTVKKLIIIGLPLFGILFFIIKDLFIFLFGDKWVIAGIYAKILVPLYCIRFISSTVSVTTSIFEKQLSTLIINLILISTTMFVFLFSKIFDMDFIVFLKLLSCFLSVNYLLFMLYYYKLVR